MTSQNIENELLITLWNHCENGCAFCYNRVCLDYPHDLKGYIDWVKSILHSPLMENFKYLRFLGGELFDGTQDVLQIKNEFEEILNISSELIANGTIIKLNFLTNLIFEDRTDIQHVLDFFEKRNQLKYIEFSSSYDKYGRFTEYTEKLWWDNIKWLQTTYPNISLDINSLMTQPFIENFTNEWLDDFIKKIGNYRINFTELDTGVDRGDKKLLPYSNLFPKRTTFLQFLKKLKDSNRLGLIGFGPGDSHPIQLLFSTLFDYPIFKDLDYMLPERVKFPGDAGYIDSEIPLFSDVKRVIDL